MTTSTWFDAVTELSKKAGQGLEQVKQGISATRSKIEQNSLLIADSINAIKSAVANMPEESSMLAQTENTQLSISAQKDQSEWDSVSLVMSMAMVMG